MILTISGRADSYVQFMTVLILFLLVLAVTYFVTKWMAGYHRSRVSNANIEVLETIGLSNNKYIQLIRIGQKYLAVAICKDTVTMLTEIPEQDLILSDGSVSKTMGFKDILDKVQKKGYSGKRRWARRMKRHFSGYHLVKLVCLLILAGILYIGSGATARAASTDTPYRDSNLTGTEGERTNIREPGTSQDADELAELNIANTVTVRYGNGNGSVNGALRVLIILTLIAVAPSLIIMLTSFTRIIIVLHFTRQALNTQTAPPNTVLIGIALFLTFFIMQPTLTTVYNEAVVPYEAGELTNEEALAKAAEPLRTFMYRQTQKKDVSLFMSISRLEWSGELDDIPMSVLVPSFIISELRTAFIIGFLIYIPFIVIDMVVASTLMSMGMMMLPPTTISMPFKILLFVLADGWYLIIKNLVESFY